MTGNIDLFLSKNLFFGTREAYTIEDVGSTPAMITIQNGKPQIIKGLNKKGTESLKTHQTAVQLLKNRLTEIDPLHLTYKQQHNHNRNLKNLKRFYPEALETASCKKVLRCRDEILSSISNREFSYFPSADPKDPIAKMIDYAEKFNRARKNGEINPKKTHLTYLSEAVRENFDALFSPYDGREGINDLREEMEKRINNRRVTYEWWFSFNFRLSILATPPEKRSSWAASITDENLDILIQNNSWKDHKSVCEYFENSSDPFGTKYDFLNRDHFLFPTHYADFKIVDINRMFASGLFAIGLSKKPLMGDGRLMWPDQFFRHDLVHLENELATMDGLMGQPLELFDAKPVREKYFQMRKALVDKGEIPQLILQLVDLTFFEYSHERSSEIHDLIKSHEQNDYEPRTPDETSLLPYFKCADWFLDHLPHYRKLGFTNYLDMYYFGKSALLTLLKPSSTEEDIYQKVMQLHRKHLALAPSLEEDQTTEVRIPQNLDNPGKEKILKLNDEELDLYNNAVRVLNGSYKGDREEVVRKIRQVTLSNAKFKSLLIDQGMLEFFQRDLSSETARSSQNTFCNWPPMPNFCINKTSVQEFSNRGRAMLENGELQLLCCYPFAG